MNPTKTSRAKKGSGTMKAINEETTIKSISPANKFPKSLNPKEKVLVNSPKASSIPTKKSIGFLKLRYFPKYGNKPSLESAFTWIYTIPNIAIEKVNIKSELGDLKKEKTPSPGINSIRLEQNT